MNYLTGAWTWLTTPANWSGSDGVWQRLVEHLEFTGVCLGLSLLIGLPVAVVLGHLGRGGALAINISNAGRAVPTLALMSVLILTPLGDTSDYWPVVISLTLFGIPPVLTNAYVGIREVDRDTVEAARGMGMTGRQVVFRVELPLAWPLLMTGVRTAAVQLVATATLAAMAGAGGLGRIITAGFDLQSTPQVVAGAVLVALLALLVEGAFALAERALDPMRPARGQPGTESSRRSGLLRRRSLTIGEDL
ncbi:ABC transporter permease [Phaeacidiphilus oryzae]|jgi:osmoprotectant transport system permease protein|uniref:ABC transporter permease n=1 Tax=Phaeacidiphilus oryzae TaxID=348818 RepID=UPI0009FC1360|nr:ABC transporter permease [Phaeacidiphilus oryzae]